MRLGCLGPVTSSWRFKFPGWPEPIFRCCGKLLPTISSAWTMARPRHPVRTIWSTIPAEYPLNSPTIRSRPCLLVRVPGCSSGNGVCVTDCVWLVLPCFLLNALAMVHIHRLKHARLALQPHGLHIKHDFPLLDSAYPVTCMPPQATAPPALPSRLSQYLLPNAVRTQYQ